MGSWVLEEPKIVSRLILKDILIIIISILILINCEQTHKSQSLVIVLDQVECQQHEYYEKDEPGIVLPGNLDAQDFIDWLILAREQPTVYLLHSLSIIKQHHQFLTKLPWNFEQPQHTINHGLRVVSGLKWLV